MQRIGVLHLIFTQVSLIYLCAKCSDKDNYMTRMKSLWFPRSDDCVANRAKTWPVSLTCSHFSHSAHQTGQAKTHDTKKMFFLTDRPYELHLQILKRPAIWIEIECARGELAMLVSFNTTGRECLLEHGVHNGCAGEVVNHFLTMWTAEN